MRVWRRSLILTMFLLNILCSGLFFGNSLSSVSYSYSYSCMPNIKQNIDCHNKSTLQSRMNMNFISVRNNDCWSFTSLFNNDVVITSHNRFLFLLNLNSCGIAPSNRLKKSSSQRYLHRFPIPGPSEISEWFRKFRNDFESSEWFPSSEWFGFA